MEDYVSYEHAQKLKEHGFDWPCDYQWQFNKNWFEGKGGYMRIRTAKPCITSSAPTMAQAAKWLREVKGILILIDILSNGPKRYYWKLYDSLFYFIGPSNEDFLTYEQALSAGIDRALELLKEE